MKFIVLIRFTARDEVVLSEVKVVKIINIWSIYQVLVIRTRGIQFN